MKPQKSLLAASAIAFISVFALIESTTAYAGRPRAGHSTSRTVTRTGVEGRAATRSTNKTITENGYQRSSTATGPNGKTATRNATGAYNPETKTWTRDASSVGPNGGVSSTNATVQKTDTGYTRDVVKTGPNGNTVTKNASSSYDASTGTLTQQRTIIGPNGATSTATREVTKAPAPTEP